MAAKGKAEAKTWTNAMDKIRDEMAKGSNYIKVVGEFLTEYLLGHPEAEDLFKAADKSIGGSLEVVKAEAKKVATGNVAVLDDATVFGMVLKYYGIQGEAQPQTSAHEQAQAPEDPFDLDALMGVL